MEAKDSIGESTPNNSIVSSTSSSILSEKDAKSSNKKKFTLLSTELLKRSRKMTLHKTIMSIKAGGKSRPSCEAASNEGPAESTPVLSSRKYKDIEMWLENNISGISLSDGDNSEPSKLSSSFVSFSHRESGRQCRTEPVSRKSLSKIKENQYRDNRRSDSSSDSDDGFEALCKNVRKKVETKKKKANQVVSDLSDFIDDGSLDTSFTLYQKVLAADAKEKLKEADNLQDSAEVDINFQAMARRLSFQSDRSSDSKQNGRDNADANSSSNHSSTSEDNNGSKSDEDVEEALEHSHSLHNSEDDKNSEYNGSESDGGDVKKSFEPSHSLYSSEGDKNSDSDSVEESSIVSSHESSSDDESLPEILDIRQKKRVEESSRLRTNRILKESKILSSSTQVQFTFLQSLTDGIPLEKCDPKAAWYKRNFKKEKDVLCRKLYQMFNEQVFCCQLPQDMTVAWNNRLRKTAGFCYNREKITASHEKIRSAKIELSTKVIDTAERLRDTLIHEMCHAAAWIINAYSRGHASHWKKWAHKAENQFPELPPIKRCHNYDIFKRFTYRCTRCGYCINRHSKSLNCDRKRCGHCHGKFELLINVAEKNGTVTQTPKVDRSPKGFARYVKENYGSVKKSNKDLKHGELMKVLATQFSAMKVGQ